VGTYCLLSALGSYSDDLRTSGKTRLAPGIAASPDSHVWEPLFMNERTDLGRTIAILYWPCVKADRRYWHPTANIFEMDLDEMERRIKPRR
jgi:hypothetical protein